MTTLLCTDVAIIGAGPAGTMAAVQLVRLGKTVALLEPAEVGGLLHEASLVENFPGFPDGIEGAALAAQLSRHLDRFGIEPIRERVEQLRWEGSTFAVRTDVSVIAADRVIVASGTAPKAIPIPVPSSAKGRVHAEVRPLRGLRDARVAVVGGGDAAFDYALQLATANNVRLLLRSKPSCLGLLLERALQRPRIRIVEGAELVGIEAVNECLALRCRVGGGDVAEEVDQILFAVGRVPNDAFLKDRDGLDALVSQGRFFFAGDVHNESRRQAAIAVGDGIMAAMRIAGGEGAWS